jgi:fluoride exporter
VPSELQKLLWIAVAGGAGSASRYAVALAVQRASGWSVFPIGTLTVNVLGSLVLGFLATALTGPLIVDERWRLALTVGFLGGFTTFSTFAVESVSLAGDRAWPALLANVVLNNGLALAAALLGIVLARRLYGVA